MAKVVCRPEGRTAKGKLKPGYRYAKRRKNCPIKAKGAKAAPKKPSKHGVLTRVGGWFKGRSKTTKKA